MKEDITTTDWYFTSVCPNVRVRNALVRSGITTMPQLCALSETQLRRVYNIGEKSLKTVLEEKAKYLAATALGEENV